MIAGSVVVALAAIAGLMARYSGFSFRPKPSSRPNVLLITIDTLRWDHVGCYGSTVATTPALDRLAARGVRFETAVMHVPLTAPSHASILTGLNPLAHGVRDNGAFALRPGLPTLASAFKAAGFQTAGFVSGFPLDRRFGFAAGFDSYDDHLGRTIRSDLPGLAASERRADLTTDRVIAWLDARRATPGTTSPSWFLWVHYFDPHAAYDPPREWLERYAGHPYDGEVAFVDHEIGRLFETVDRSSGPASTLVLVTADHGESLGDHGEETHGVFVYDATLRVPWIMAGPGVPEATVSPVVARGVDVMPTLLDLAGVRVPVSIDGRSLAPAVRGARVSDEPAYLESLLSARHFGWAELHGIRTARWKYIEAPSPELYDLAEDGRELRNVVGKEVAQASSMSRRLDATLRSGAAASSVPRRDVESERRLGALGYINKTVSPTGPGARRDPKSSVALINRLEHAIAETHVDPRRAALELQSVLEEDPGIAIARSQLAMAFSSVGNHPAAVEQIERLKAAGAAGPADILLLSESLRATGRARDAKLARDEAARLDPASPEPALTEARADMAADNPTGAAAAYRRALDLAPEHPEALAGLGEIALRDGDAESASAYFERVLSQAPGDFHARTRLGMIRGRQGRLEEAIGLLRSVVQEAPDNGEALAGLAAALARSGSPAAAVPYFERALAAGPPTPAVLNGLGFARLESGDRGGALTALQASLAVDPDQPRILAVINDLKATTDQRGRR